MIRILTQRYSSVQVKSICPEGTILKAINILKDGKDPVAMKDEDYPEWLWKLKHKKERNWGGEEDKLSLDYLRQESKAKIKSNTLASKTK
jgi:large subunit ribosomal protein L54